MGGSSGFGVCGRGVSPSNKTQNAAMPVPQGTPQTRVIIVISGGSSRIVPPLGPSGILKGQQARMAILHASLLAVAGWCPSPSPRRGSGSSSSGGGGGTKHAALLLIAVEGIAQIAFPRRRRSDGGGGGRLAREVSASGPSRRGRPAETAAAKATAGTTAAATAATTGVRGAVAVGGPLVKGGDKVLVDGGSFGLFAFALLFGFQTGLLERGFLGRGAELVADVGELVRAGHLVVVRCRAELLGWIAC